MSSNDLLSGWKDVDSQPNPSEYVDYLEKTREWARQDFLDHLTEKYAFLDIKPGQKILDVGYGTGFDIEMLCRLTKGMIPETKIYGVDYSQAMFAATQRRLTKHSLHARVFIQDAYSLKRYKDNFFDRVFSRTLLQHLDRPVDALREQIRVTKVGGLVAAIETDWSHMFGSGLLSNSVVDLSEQIRLSNTIPSYGIAAELEDIMKERFFKLIIRKHDTKNIDIPFNHQGLYTITVTQHTVVGEKQ